MSVPSERFFDGFNGGEGSLPEVRDQGEEGACWSFATMGALETDIIHDGNADKEDVDLSELQLA